MDYPTVPSQQIPYPEIGEGYFNGGYNVANHTSYLSGNKVNGVQMECYYAGIRDTEANRNKFGVAFAADILIEYLSIHRNVDVSNCNTLSKKEIAQEPINIYPNPVKRAERNLFISGIENLQK